MKIIRFDDVPEVPASHEDPDNPGALKKVLFRLGDLASGHIQMVNWATLLPGKSFSLHYHEDMQEVFIMISGMAIAKINEKEITLKKGDALVVEAGEKHEMYNPGKDPVPYIVIGIAGDNKGKSVNV